MLVMSDYILKQMLNKETLLADSGVRFTSVTGGKSLESCASGWLLASVHLRSVLVELKFPRNGSQQEISRDETHN